MTDSVLSVLVDGREPDTDALLPFSLANDGHFTAMQVRDRATRGIALHLRRMAAAHSRLYGTEIDAERVRSLMRKAVLGHPDAYLRVSVTETAPGHPRILTVVRPPIEPDPRPVALVPVASPRVLPEIKHAGTFHQIQLARDAQAQGFDDALLVDPAGRIGESTIANIAFPRGSEVFWPDGPALEGITWQLLEPALGRYGFASRRAEVSLADLSGFPAAVLVNSIGVTPVARIGGREFTASGEAATTLGQIYRQIPADPI